MIGLVVGPNVKRAVGLLLLTGTFAASPAAALAADPGLFLGRTADLSDALVDSTVIDGATPSLNVLVTNRTGSEAKLYGVLDGRTAVATVPARAAIVRLSWPTAAAGRQKVQLLLVSGQAQDAEQHEIVVRDAGDGYGSHYGAPTPYPTVRHTRPPSPSPSAFSSPTPSQSSSSSQSVSPSPSPSGQLAKTGHKMGGYVITGGAMVLLGLLALAAAQMLGQRTRRAESR